MVLSLPFCSFLDIPAHTHVAQANILGSHHNCTGRIPNVAWDETAKALLQF